VGVEELELGADAGIGSALVSLLDGELVNDEEFAMGASPIPGVVAGLIGDGSGLEEGVVESRSGEVPEEGDRRSLDSKIVCSGGE